MYQFFLFLHSWLRWVVIILMLTTLIISFINIKNNEIKNSHRKFFGLYRTMFGIEVLIGLILYFFVSPITTYFLYESPGEIINNPVALLYTLKHPLTMILAFLVCRAGQVRAEKSESRYYKVWFICTLIVIFLLFLAIPWPFFDNGRPMIRL